MVFQKSKSDAGFSKHRSQAWQRSKSHGNQPVSTSVVPVSESTKSKLSNFQFGRDDASGTTDAAAASATTTATSSTTGSKTAVPVTRLAWSDLPDPAGGPTTRLPTPADVDAGDPSNDHDADDAPPTDQDAGETSYDRITWENRKDGLSGPAMSAMLSSRKGRKRAHSSSPLSSPARGDGPPAIATPAVNIKKLARALRTPNANPTLELWDRFSVTTSDSGAGGKGGPSSMPFGLAHPGLAQVMVSSSPRPSDGSRGPGGGGGKMKRALSAGQFNWNKRRRLEMSDSPLFSGHSFHAGTEHSPKTSLVTALVDTFTSSVRQRTGSPAPETTAPGSSPSSRERIAPEQEDSSPTRRVSKPARQPAAGGQGLLAGAASAKPPPPVVDPILMDLDSDDFDDDDFDDDALLELEITAVPQQQKPPPKPDPLPADTRMSPPEPAKPAGNPGEDENDEFGLLDDDIFEGAEEFAASLAPLPRSASQATRDLQDALDDSFGPDEAEELAASLDPGPKPVPQTARDLEEDFNDDFGDDIDFDALEAEAIRSLSQARPTPPTTIPAISQRDKSKAIQRYLVTNVLESEFRSPHGQAPEKILVVKVDGDSGNAFRTVHLREDWFDTEVKTGSYIHVIGQFVRNSCVVDNDRHILVVHPDHLISATVVADSFTCIRRAVLQDRVKATSDPSPPLVYGTILHEIFQEALRANRWDGPFLTGKIETITQRHIEDLYAIKVTVAAAREHLQFKMPELCHWAAMFVAEKPRAEGVVLDRGGKKANMCVAKLLDVEEHVWSPMYGLKGNIDATVEVVMRDGSTASERRLTVPLEVKTGRSVNVNHVAQTSLYNLLLSDRYDIEILYGVLYYMETSATHRIPAIRTELRHMIMQRNRLACHVMERSVQLPPMKRSKNLCRNCYAKTACFVYHRLADDGTGETSGLDGKFDEAVRHLTPRHKEFFLEWENLLTWEEKESQKFRRELWTMVSAERERKGRCFGDVVIEPGSMGEDPDAAARINKYRYTFVKRVPVPGFSFVESQITVGEPVVVSDEQGHFALALGYVTSVHKRRISVAVDRRLHNARIRQPGFDERNNQVFAGVMEVAPDADADAASQGGLVREAPIRYRLDKDEFSNGMSMVRNNLVKIMSDEAFGAHQIRRLVVDLDAPRFKAVATQYSIADPGSLNVDQHAAIAKVMSARDYALVLGMPGTGKTTTIAHIIRALTSQGKSVLLTSYTHTAVDNILLKLKDDRIPILRLGAPAKVHPDVQQFATLAGHRMDSFDEIRDAWLGSPVVATTCLGIGHPLFNERTFDYCIVDEASQITLPICLGPIRLAATFVLVGDHNQLPPLVRNDEARDGGLDVSLFKLLSDTHPQSVVNLEHQYRMCEDVMTLSNQLIYHGRLRCGTESLRRRKLHVPNLDALRRMHNLATGTGPTPPPRACPGASDRSCWLRALLDPETRVAFVNTDSLRPRIREEAKGNRIVNPAEARVVVQLVEALLACGVPETDVGVMTHYRSQLSLLRHGLRGRAGVELDTADRFQGRDKEVIVLSLVRSNDACAIGELLRDWRRINVAFTRAKTKLLVLGSRDTLKGSGADEMLSRFIGLMEERDWVYDLPSDALDSHAFEDAATQMTLSPPGKAMVSTARQRGAGLSAPGGGNPSAHRQWAPGGKENRGVPPPPPPRLVGGEGGKSVAAKRGRIGEAIVLKGKPVLRDILNEMMDGGY